MGNDVIRDVGCVVVNLVGRVDTWGASEMPIWSKEEVAYAAKLYAKGLSYTQIAARLSAECGHNRSRSSVGGKLDRAKLNGKRGGSQNHRTSRLIKISQGLPDPANVPGKKADPEIIKLLHVATVVETVSNPQAIVVRRDGKLCANDLLTADCCRWPIGDPRSVAFHFCGAEKVPNRSYCNDHSARAFQATTVALKIPVKNPEKVQA